jgi:hypothetical protein
MDPGQYRSEVFLKLGIPLWDESVGQFTTRTITSQVMQVSSCWNAETFPSFQIFIYLLSLKYLIWLPRILFQDKCVVSKETFFIVNMNPLCIIWHIALSLEWYSRCRMCLIYLHRRTDYSHDSVRTGIALIRVSFRWFQCPILRWPHSRAMQWCSNHKRSLFTLLRSVSHSLRRCVSMYHQIISLHNPILVSSRWYENRRNLDTNEASGRVCKGRQSFWTEEFLSFPHSGSNKQLGPHFL